MSLFSKAEVLDGPFVMVIFGATGDLTKRKLLPALFRLHCDGLLPTSLSIIGCARRDIDATGWQADMRAALSSHGQAEQIAEFIKLLDYVSLDFGELEHYHELRKRMETHDAAHNLCGRRLYYLATPADTYDTILDGLSAAELHAVCGVDGGWTKIILEKPFGRDQASAKALNEHVGKLFSEDQIFRIDHYLAKETAQNMFAFRFANSLFEPMWSCRHIERIEIRMTETLGVEGRGGFYEVTGALRDVLQNHLLQLLALTTMDEPAEPTTEQIRDQRANILEHLELADHAGPHSSVTIGQYAGYRAEPDVADDSRVETFVAAKAVIKLPRWQDTDIYLLTGKAMSQTATTVSVYLRRTSPAFFTGSRYNVLTFNIQPTEGVSISLVAKRPGYADTLEPVTMHFDYAKADIGKQADPYSRLLHDCLRGDQTLFTRSDEVEAEWRFIDPIVHEYEHAEPLIYPRGSSVAAVQELSEDN